MYLSTSTFNFAKSKYSSKNIGKYKFKYFVKNSSTSTKYLKTLVKYSHVHRTLHLCFIMVKVSDEITKAAVFCMCLHVCNASQVLTTSTDYLSVIILSQVNYVYHNTSELVALDHLKPQ